MPARKWKWIVGAVLALAAVPFLIVRLTEQPSNDRTWATDQRLLPEIRRTRNVVTIGNVRNFVYRSEDNYIPRWEQRTYDLAKLDSLWFVVERFGDFPGLAHTLLSFGFGDEYVAISAEIRKEEGEEYSPLGGLLRQYELMYVIGDERDLLALRTNHRRDVVFLYPVKTTPEKMRALFLAMVGRADRLRRQPEFYNTLTNTCFSNIVRHVNTLRLDRVPLSRHMVLPSGADVLAYEVGLIDTSAPLEQVRARHRIDLHAQTLPVDERWSARVREKLPVEN